jgi:hypothetical protein
MYAQDIREKYQLYLYAIFLILLGILCLIISEHFLVNHKIYYHIIRDLGIALIISGTIAAVIEGYLRRRLYDEIKKVIKNFHEESINSHLFSQSIPVAISTNINQSLTKFPFYRKDYNTIYTMACPPIIIPVYKLDF